MSRSVIVTGACGKLGAVCVPFLVERGYTVFAVDQAPKNSDIAPFSRVNLTDYGQTISALGGIDDRSGKVDAIVHLAAIAAPGQAPNQVIFETNTLSTYNVFEAARVLGIETIVSASSETVLGLPFETPPAIAPVAEDAVLPETSYSLSKLVGETMAAQYCRRNPSLKISNLRFSNVQALHDYARFPDWQDDPQKRRFNLWGYIDARDASLACALSMEANFTGSEIYVIANADTVMEMPSRDLMAAVFPGTPLRDSLKGNETLLAIDKARAELGFEPVHDWRSQLG